MKRILILCTNNSARSQMAEGWLHYFDSELDVHSAGTHPAAAVHPTAIEVMAEVGIDLSAARPTSVEAHLDEDFDWLVTVCSDAKQACPEFSGRVANRVHIAFEDPAAAQGAPGEVQKTFRSVRDLMRMRLYRFYCEKLGPLLRDAAPGELETVLALLASAGVPSDGVAECFGPSFGVAERNGALIGVAGIELYGRFGLLRSVAVESGFRRRGLGLQLVRNRIDWAREHGIDSLFLASATATDLFNRAGFHETPRLAVPIEVRTSPEFERNYTDAATVMDFRIR